MAAKKNNTLLYGGLAVAAVLLFSSRKSQPANNTPQCPPGYYWNGATCVKIQTTGGNTPTGGSSGGFWGGLFNSLPGIIDSTGNLVNAIQTNNAAQGSGVGYIYQLRY